MTNNSNGGCANKPVVVLIGTLAALAGIYTVIVLIWPNVLQWTRDLFGCTVFRQVVVDMKGQVWTETITEVGNYRTHPIHNKDVGNFSFEADIRIDDPSSEFHGLTFRQQDSERFYSFRINQDGAYLFDIWTGGGGHTKLLGPTLSTLVRKGVGESNHLKVIAKGEQFELSVNGEKVATATETTYREGELGLLVCTCDDSSHASATFSNVVVWK